MLDTEVKATKESSHSVTFPAKAFAAQSATSGLGPFTLQRRTPRAQDVQIEILYCGVCHSDLHQVRDEWNLVMPTVYPCVPGHEMVGRVVKVGSAVKKFKEGDIAAAGCMVMPMWHTPPFTLLITPRDRDIPEAPHTRGSWC